MILLLDTNALLWWLTDDPRLSRPAYAALADPDSSVFVSAACVWEVSVKAALGKLEVPADWIQAVEASRLLPLPITLPHALAAGQLPLLHRDPFDRILIAQAQSGGLTIVTRDPHIARYDVPILRA